ncbi:MAG: CoA ester lyase [Novosphingobium sp.]|nr:CoA ester lyase [Novosphingobium sp.]
MSLRSLLFVPGDRPDRFAKAAASGADAIILDLEDAVAAGRKAEARAAVAEYLSSAPPVPCFVRFNPLASPHAREDVALVARRPAGIVLPKVEGPDDIRAWLGLIGDDAPPLLPLASETPAAVFTLGTYRPVAAHLAGMTWGAEDLTSAMGAQPRTADGSLTGTCLLARALTVLGAHAAGVQAIETVFPAIDDLEALARYVADARRDGFSGMMALHPAQVPIINAGFTPSAEDAAQAQRIVDAFAAHPGAGVLKVDGKMLDAPHLKQALVTLERYAQYAAD